MLTQKTVDQFKKRLPRGSTPAWHIVLGSGFGKALDELKSEGWKKTAEIPFNEISGLATATTQDHAGKFAIYTHKQRTFIFQMGRLHGYEGHAARTAIEPVMLSRLLGTPNFLLTNAAGGLQAEHKLGDVMLIRDHVNLTGQNPLAGENPKSLKGEPLGPRFPDMSGAYDTEWRRSLSKAFTHEGLTAHEGIYLGLLGPSFETPAEIELFGRWGVHAVGMSTVWEAIALKHSGARVGGLSLISNAAAGLGDGEPLDHEKILEICRGSAQRIVATLLKWLERQ